ncbi:MAG TPA: thioredoxin-like domain-containing protein [Flavobacterium sp.]
MTIKKAFLLFIFVCQFSLFISCGKDYNSKDYTAYFGGEVTNPTSRHILFFKGDDLVDTIDLDINNRFFVKFDSLTPGLYTFKHEPEYQYVYFDKNDSMMVTINSRDFDESIVFSGRGDAKNNFLMEMYLKNDKDRDQMFTVFDYDFPRFSGTIEDTHKKHLKYYADKKEELNWSEDFDIYARAAVDFPYYSKKEIYPIVHQVRTGNDIMEILPKNYYAYRKKIDYNDNRLSNYAPFVKYLSHMLNNVATISYHNHFTDADLSLKTNTSKLNIADTLIRNEKMKNKILNNIAFTYLLEDQNMVNNQKFLEAYHKYSTDKSQRNEILRIGSAIRLLKVGNTLPEVMLVDQSGDKISSTSLLKNETVVFFWTEKSQSHLIESHKRALMYKEKYPNYSFIAVNLDDDQEKWNKTLSGIKFGPIIEARSADFEDIRSKWAITKIHRTIVIDHNCKIKNAFTNLFDAGFEENLKVAEHPHLKVKSEITASN